MKEQEEVIDFRAIYEKAIAHWKLFVISSVVILGLAVLYLKLTQPTYQIQSNILIKKEEKGGAGGALQSALTKNLGFGAFNMGSDVDDEIQIVNSYTIALNAVKELHINKTYILKEWGGLKKTDLYTETPLSISCEESICDTLSVDVATSIKINKDGSGKATIKIDKFKEKVTFAKLPYLFNTPYGKFLISTTEQYKPGKKYSMNIGLSGYPIATEVWRKKTSIGIVSKKSNAIHLELKDKNVTRGKMLLDKIVELYNADGVNEKNIVASNTADFLKERLEIIYADLGVSEEKVEKYKKENNLTDIPTEVKIMMEKMGDFKEKSLEVETQYSIVGLIENYLQNPKNKYSLVPANLGLQDESMTNALQAYNTLLLDRMKIISTSNETNPTIKLINHQAEAMLANILTSVKNVKEGLNMHINELNRQEGMYMSRIQGLPTVEREYIDIKRQQLIKEQLYIFLLEKQEENDLAIAVTAPKAKIIDKAYISAVPVSPKASTLLLIALAMGLGIPAAFIYLKELLTTTFQHKEDVEKLTKLPILGEIGINTEETNIVVGTCDNSVLAEQFRLLRTNIPFVLNNKNEKVIMVTSTVKGEGKSFISSNLALSLSLLNKKIALIGFDIRSPKLLEYLNVKPKGKGVTGFLASTDITVDQIIIRDSAYGNLDLIPAGAIPPNPGELIMSNRTDQLFKELRQLYDYIIVDSAPVGLISDSFNLTQHVDATIYVTRANFSNKRNIEFVNDMVKENKLKKVSIVVNGSITHINRYGYGYGYGANKKG